ncbi:hypothetical protein BGX26_007522, partial [Mortierella sp. AD094]
MTSTTTASPTLNLCCVISGNKASTASDFDIDRNWKVSKLKEKIQQRKFPELRDPDEIDLWAVTIPLIVDEEDKEITAASVSSKQPMKGALVISQYFPHAPPNTIHIIVEQPK